MTGEPEAAAAPTTPFGEEGVPPSPAPGGDEHLLERLQAGDEAAFAQLVSKHHAAMVRVARAHVATAAAADEVAQEAWVGVLEGLDRFQGPCSVKSWIFAIVVNCAKTRGVRDRRSVPFSALGQADDEGGPSVEPERFLDEGHPRWPGHWARAPEAWDADALVSRETLATIADAMATLPSMQRAVMTMRDVEGLDADETCRVLGISDANQRVLLHRGRSKVRKIVEAHLSESEGAS